MINREIPFRRKRQLNQTSKTPQIPPIYHVFVIRGGLMVLCSH